MRKFERLTPSGMRSLQPGESICEQGLIYTRLNNGDGTWSVNLMVDGQRIRRALGKESDGVTRVTVEKFIEQVKTEAREKRLKLPKGRKLAMSFAELSSKYLERLRELGDTPETAKKQYRLNSHILPFFAQKVVEQTSSFDIERYKHTRQVNGASSATINRELAVISHMVNRAKAWGWIAERPFEIKKLKEEQTKTAYLTPAQCERFIRVARTKDHQLAAFIRIGLATGMRRSNILSLRIENIDFDHNRIYLPQTKTGARYQPMTWELAEYLKWYISYYIKEDEEWLFPSKLSSTGHRTEVAEGFKSAVIEAGLDPDEVTPHTMRHTVVSTLVQAGIDIHTIMDITGHKSQEMVLRYSHRDGQHIQTAMDKLADVTQVANVVVMRPGKKKEQKEA